jgi:hypothetical protein
MTMLAMVNAVIRRRQAPASPPDAGMAVNPSAAARPKAVSVTIRWRSLTTSGPRVLIDLSR